jgi:hypothetical protein
LGLSNDSVPTSWYFWVEKNPEIFLCSILIVVDLEEGGESMGGESVTVGRSRIRRGTTEVLEGVGKTNQFHKFSYIC